jgi:hypothetical protein
LYRQRSLRAAEAHLVLYENARHYVESELLGGTRPIDDLRAILGDQELAEVVPHVVNRPGVGVVHDDQRFDDAAVFMENVWSVVRCLQQRESGPVIFALVGGRRRSLSVNMATAFQLLARPQDRLIDVRLVPKYGDDPRWGFFFPDQTSPCVIETPRGEVFEAADVVVQLADIRVPRMRRLLCDTDLQTFAHAVAAGEEALERGPIPRLVVDVKHRALLVGDQRVGLSKDQMVWYVALVVRRLTTKDGWLPPDDAEVLPLVFEACRRLWGFAPEELSDAYDYDHDDVAKRLNWLRPLRTRARRRVRENLRGHPHARLFIPTIERSKGSTRNLERVLIDPESIELRPNLQELLGWKGQW